MLKWFKNMPEWAFLTIYLGSVLIINTLLGLQGFDMFDEGWVLTTYQQLFEHPQSAEYQFLYYNGVFVGALWNLAFAKLGILGFRILTALCRVAIAGCVYGLLKKIVNRWLIFAGILLVIINPGYVIVFHHNVLTALFCCLSALFIFKSTTEKKSRWMLLAGVIVGINIFTRLTNVAMLSLILILIPVYVYTKDKNFTWELFGCAIAGCAFGIVAQLIMMECLGHLDIFVQNLTSGFSASTAEDSTHSLSNLMHVYYKNYKLVGKLSVYLLFYPICIWIVNRIALPNKWLRIVLVAMGIAYVYFIWPIAKGIYAVYAFCYLLFAISLYINRNDENCVYLITIASIIMFFLPFGSDYGIGNMGSNCIWIAFPLALGLAYEVCQKLQVNSKFGMAISIWAFISVFVIRSSYNLCNTCYFDNGSRLDKTSLISHPLANTYTTKENCNTINELLSNLNNYVSERDYLLSYLGLPMVHYLTHTYPYLDNSFPWTYDAENLERQFRYAEGTKNVYPVIVRNKSAIEYWQTYNADWDSELSMDQYNFNTKKIQLIQSFQKKYNYHVVWENDLFQILLPNNNEDVLINKQKI